MIEVRHLRMLQTLHEAGSLTGAARRMHLTQSAVSHQIKELESRLEVTLVARGQRPLRFTRAGLRLLGLAGEVLPALDEALADLRRLTQGDGGRLHIASECHSCLDWLLPKLRGWRSRYPGIDVDVALSASLDPLPGLLDGRLDLVLTPDRRELPGIAWTPLFSFAVVLISAPDHPLAGKPHVRATDLANETLLTYPVARERLDVFTRFLWPAGVEPARVRTAETTAMLVELAALGQGVTALPLWAVKHVVEAGDVAMVPLDPKGMEATLLAATPEENMALPHVVEFIKQLGEDTQG
ncbi:transcriptional regulator MetR [Thioalkalivibrio sulfidiphilus HL-EbGr7]|uniref:Transcriptional regulator MetR n=1 Tax=Thioalkalivibrio sulfidiphilus (strain HL-EbGR7) TaxID=396588 RepID=B8GUP3_THISH|nr:LysR family transcriptional regulator [Thioalkalivibrio sulfidiphilus]ACL71404.1 transcriptional regulator MetR [Thioalkalivibrio sulfidiphilus HL-EbGr7]